MNGGQNPNAMIPQVLLQNSSQDENQDTILTTVRLEPNASSQISSVFILPKSGSVLDSNSSLVWSLGWNEFAKANMLAAGTIDQAVLAKHFSGSLNSIQRARLYVGGRLLFENPDVGLSAHIHKLATNPDHYQEVEDCKLGSNHGIQLEQPGAALAARGKIQTGSDGLVAVDAAARSDQLCRIVGSYALLPANNYSWEATILLSEVFPALKHLQLPVKFLKDEVRIEIDWNTDFKEVLNMACNNTTAIVVADQTAVISNPLLYLDYLTYNDEVEAGLAMASQQGITIPYREIDLIRKQLPAITAANTSQDIFLGFQGKLLMKIYVSHKFSNTGITTANPANPAAGPAYFRFNGRCRSDMGENLKYNLIINDLHIHDAKVDTASQQYSYLSMTAENPIYAFPNSFDFNCLFNRGANAGAAADGDISSSLFVAGGREVTANDTNDGISACNARDGIMGTQAFIGFDLSRYGVEGGLTAQNAGFRVGSTPIILNIEQDGGGAATRQRSVKQVDVICESVKMLQIRNGMIDTMEA
tara:strand:- start:3327 stop:4919 length:1593 start_codon:yes stop_codon:yes gene_type:complete